MNIGRLTDQKNQILILKAINQIKKEIDVQLYILGKGINYQNLKNYIMKNRLQKIVKLIGYKKNPYPYLKQSDIFILSSNFEGSPNVLIEAMFLKNTIISTNCPTGPKEILKNGKLGKLIKMDDAKNLANALKNFKKDKKKIKSAFKSIHIYDHKINCHKYYKLVEEIIF